VLLLIASCQDGNEDEYSSDGIEFGEDDEGNDGEINLEDI
jgi:hypothetical protein